MAKTLKGKSFNFAYALKSFIGYLEGTRKAHHTIRNYRLDIEAFGNFLQTGLGPRPFKLEELTQTDVELYHFHLKSLGFKTNTRRRKLMTVRRFLSYLALRKKLPVDLGKRLLTPHKNERIPLILPTPQLIESIKKLPVKTVIEARNRLLLWVLAETGCLVSELSLMRYEQWSKTHVQFEGKSARIVPISSELYEEVQRISNATEGKENPWIFYGFNKFGSLGAPITSRGVELLVKHYRERLGFKDLTPRTFRHSVAIHWIEAGITQTDVQSRLGLKTAYAFRAYGPVLLAKSNSKTTSTS